jgi:hypothetical protein
MNTTNEDVAMWFGGCCGVVLSITIFLLLTGLENTKIQQCELELPRNQKCILIAVPEVTGDN